MGAMVDQQGKAVIIKNTMAAYGYVLRRRSAHQCRGGVLLPLMSTTFLSPGTWQYGSSSVPSLSCEQPYSTTAAQERLFCHDFIAGLNWRQLSIAMAHTSCAAACISIMLLKLPISIVSPDRSQEQQRLLNCSL